MLIWRGVGIGLQVLRPCWDLLASVRLLGVGRFCGERCTTTAAQPCHHHAPRTRSTPGGASKECNELVRCLPRWEILVRPQPVAPVVCKHACVQEAFPQLRTWLQRPGLHRMM